MPQLLSQGGGGHKDHLLPPLHQLVPVVVVPRLVQNVDQIQLPLLHPPDQGLRLAGGDVDHHLGVLLPVAAQDGGQLGKAQGLDGPQVQPPVEGPRLGDGQPGLVHLVEHVVGVCQKLLPLGGQGDVLSDPVKQPGVQLLLQLADLHRHRRLGVPQALRRPGEALEPGHLDKRVKLPQFHGRLLPCFPP